MFALSRVLLVGLAIGVVACSTKSGTSRSSGNSHLKPRYFLDAMTPDDSYTSTFDRFTEIDRTHSEFLPVMVAHATFWNSSVRESYIRERVGRFRLNEAEEKKIALQELQENETYFVFIVSAAAQESEWNDLDRNKSIWRVTLESEDSKIQINPERIEAISQKDEQSRFFYKYMDNFSRTYRIRFPREKLRAEENLILHITGVRGDLEFSFENDSVNADAEPSTDDDSE